MKKLILVAGIILLTYFIAGGMILQGFAMEGMSVLMILGIIQLIGTVWALFKVATTKRSGLGVIIWLIVILFIPLGWLVYYFIGDK